MNKKVFIFALIAITMVVLAVSCKTQQVAPAPQPVVTPEPEVKPEVKPEPVFVSRNAEIVLEGNATTGYTWTIIPDNSGVYEVVSEEYIPFAAPEGMVGVGGNYTAVIKSTKEGRGVVALEYARGWENAPVKRFEYVITVDNTGRFVISEN